MSAADDDKAALRRDAMRRVAIVQDILRRWDPIGVCPGEMAPADEYDSYAPHIVSMVAQGCSLEELQTRLEEICVESMGLGTDSAREYAIASEILKALRRSG